MPRIQGSKDVKKRRTHSKSSKHKAKLAISVKTARAQKKATIEEGKRQQNARFWHKSSPLQQTRNEIDEENNAMGPMESAEEDSRCNDTNSKDAETPILPGETHDVEEVEVVVVDNSSHNHEEGEQVDNDEGEVENGQHGAWVGYHNPEPIHLTHDADPDGLDSHDGDHNMNNADSDAVTDDSIMQAYCQAIQHRLQCEVASQGPNKLPQLENRWLLEYLKIHNWWIPNYDARLISKKLRLPFSEPWYYRDICMWLPDVRWGINYMPSCPNCDSNHNVSFHCFRHNHFGRTVIGLETNYYVMSRRYICSKCKADCEAKKNEFRRQAAAHNLEIRLITSTEETKNYTFMAWNDRTLELYPHNRGTMFPAVLSWRSGIDKLILRMTRPLMDKNFRPQQIQSLLKELHTVKYTDDHLEREHDNQKERLGGRDTKYKGVFSDFNDTSKYNGAIPTGKYISEMYKKQHKSIQRHQDLEVKKRPARRLHIDVSYKEAKLLFRYKGKPVFKGLCTVTNELGEIRMQFHVYTDDHEQLKSALIAFLHTTKEYGQPDVELVFTDKPRQDKKFFREIFPTLVESESKMNIDEANQNENIDDNTYFEVARNQIHYTTTSKAIEEKAIALKAALMEMPTRIVGLDCEWKVVRSHATGRIIGSDPVGTIQMACKQEDGEISCYVFQVSRLKSLPKSLIDLLTDDTITFVGVQIGTDISAIATSFNCESVQKKCKRINLGGWCARRNLVENGRSGLDAISEKVLGKKIQKDDMVRCSDWSKINLTDSQLVYAATDAVVSLEIYLEGEKCPDLSLRLKKVEVEANLTVDIVPSKGMGYNMLSRAALGKIISQSELISYPAGITCTTKPNQRHHLVAVTIDRVLAPNLFIPNFKLDDTGAKATIGDFGNAPFNLVLPLKMLRHHDTRENVPMTIPQIQPVLERHDTICQGITQPAPLGDTTTVEEVNDENDENLDIIPDILNIGRIDSDADDVSDRLTDEDIEILQKLRHLDFDANDVRKKIPLKHPKLDDPPEAIKNSYSSVLGDAFHVIDGIKVSTKTEARKLFKVAFRDSLLAWDQGLLKRLVQVMMDDGFPPSRLQERKKKLRELMRNQGYSEEDMSNTEKLKEVATRFTLSKKEIDKMMYFNPSLFKSCIPRRILPPKQTYWKVRATFIALGDTVDTSTGTPLFNDKAWERANNVLKMILDGLISDPPGHSFYSCVLDSNGCPKLNRYGFQILRCNRGTNDVENIHKNLTATFRNWQVGIELSDCLLRERRHRHNHNVSIQRRFGFPDLGHYDTWKIDLLQNLVEANHGILLHPEWSNASDMKQTPESTGTIALHDSQLGDEMQTIEVGDDVQYTAEVKYLMKAMGTNHPFLPVAEAEEEVLFNKMMLQNGSKMKEHQMAIEWCKHVNGKSVFPKLPVHLRTHYKTWEKNHRARELDKASKPILLKLQKINEIFGEDTDSNVLDDGDAPRPPINTPAELTQAQVTLQPTFAPILPRMQHNRATTVVGNAVIYHDETMMAIAMTTVPKYQGQRGKDKKKRKRLNGPRNYRPCRSCGMSSCKGKYPNGKCENCSST